MTAPKPRLLPLDYGTGNPVGLPDYRPVNPWGRAMPRPSRKMRGPADGTPVDDVLWQVEVKDNEHGGKRLRIGPKAPHEFVRQFFEALSISIRLGEIHGWSDAQMVRA